MPAGKATGLTFGTPKPQAVHEADELEDRRNAHTRHHYNAAEAGNGPKMPPFFSDSLIKNITRLVSAPLIGYNAVIMSSLRFVIGSLFIAALFFPAVNGNCAEQNIDQQIAERTRQYQESLRQRARQLSPSFQDKIESQARQTVAKGLKKWNNGELHLRIALPRLAEKRRVAQFVAWYLPNSHSPAGSLVNRAGGCAAALTVTSVQLVLKSSAISTADCPFTRSVVFPFRQSENVLSYFIRVVCTIVQRR